MSETVHYTGRLKLVEKLENETLEEQCKRVLSWHNYTDLRYCDSWEEMLCDELYKKYVIHNENVYEVVERRSRDMDDDVFEAIENSDGSISYVVRYYNGGCSFDEAIGYALDKL